VENTTEEFERIIDKHSRRVLSTARNILGDYQRAQDVHQEVFLSIWKRWHKYNGQTNWPAYLYRATVRKALELAKNRKYQSLDKNDNDSLAKNQSPDDSLRTEELRQKLAELIAALPKRQADAFILAKIEGIQSSEIARMLGCSVETVRVHLHRATKQLADKLAKYSTYITG
jgi:RNA polymerase sigma-70 factor (ECF subfamily)